MRLGAYTACLHGMPLRDALGILAGLGLDSAEINSGGFLPPVHLPIEELRSSETARSEYLALFDEAGVALTALNCNGNPLDPDPEGARQARDIYTSIELAALLGVKRVVTMSGAPGSEPSSRLPVWNVVPWHSAFLRIRDYQWNEVAIPFWKKVHAFAADHDVRVCLEMHPGNVVDSTPGAATNGWRRVLIGPEHPYVAAAQSMPFAGVGHGGQEFFTYQARAFLDEISGLDRLPRQATFADGLHNLQVQRAVIEAAATGSTAVVTL